MPEQVCNTVMIPSDEYEELIRTTRYAFDEVIQLRAAIRELTSQVAALQRMAHTHADGPDYMTQKW